MMGTRSGAAAIVWLLAVGCAKEGDVYIIVEDDDGTAVPPGSEPAPTGVDSDGDGITDAAETEQGLDPESVDTDDDGYTDAEELHAGTDPLDDDDVIYVGGWPYNPDKDLIVGEPLSATIQVGEVLGRFQGVDQHGDLVDLYDFAGDGKPVFLNYTRKTLSECVTYGVWANDPIYSSDPQTDLFEYHALAETIARGEIHWVAVVSVYDDPENHLGYAEAYVTNLPQVVMYDATGELRDHLGLEPPDCSVVLADADLRVLAYDPDDPLVALDAADAMF